MSVPRPKQPDHPEPQDAPVTPRATPLVTARWTTAARVLGIVIGAVLAIEFLRLARAVVLPLVAGIFLAILARPLHVRVREALPRRVRWLGLVVAMLAIIAGIAAFGGALAYSARAVANEFQSRRPHIESQIERLRAVAARAEIPLPQPLQGGRSTTDTARAAEPPDRGGIGVAGASGAGSGSTSTDVASRVLSWLSAGLTGLALALAFAALGLAEASEVRRRIAHLGHGDGAQRALAAIDEAAPTFRRYVWVKTLTSVIAGVATWLASLALGLPLAWVWGFLAFLLEYVPSVGSLLAVIPPTLMALAEGGPTKGIAVLLVVGALQIILGNVVDPRIEGRMMSISPFGVLLSIVFWGWLWGATGALLAVPLTIAIVIACRHTPGAHGFATVVAGDGTDDRDGQ